MCEQGSASIILRQISVAEAFANPDFPALCREYAAESALAGLPDPQEKLFAYQALENSGSAAFRVYGAFLSPTGGLRPPCPPSPHRAEPGGVLGEALIGFMALLTPVLPHYGTAVSVAESLFVASAHRKTGAGMLLIRQAEKTAKELRSPGLLFSAPSGPLPEGRAPRAPQVRTGQSPAADLGRLAVLLPRIGYRETNRVFLKGFTYE